MKYFLIPFSLFVTACVGTIDTTTLNEASVATYNSPEPSFAAKPTVSVVQPRPNADALNLSIVTQSDQQVSGEQLRALVSGKTVYSQKLENPSETQVGNFSQDGLLRVNTGSQTINGNWKIQGDQLCYLLSGKEFCSSVHRSAYDYRSQPVYYFRRASGEPTVVITGIS